MLMGIKEILVITRPDEKKLYQNLLKSGKQFGVKFKYISQKKPNGIAQSLLLGKKFIGRDNVALILGDNFFYSEKLEKTLINATKKNPKAMPVKKNKLTYKTIPFATVCSFFLSPGFTNRQIL